MLREKSFDDKDCGKGWKGVYVSITPLRHLRVQNLYFGFWTVKIFLQNHDKVP